MHVLPQPTTRVTRTSLSRRPYSEYVALPPILSYLILSPDSPLLPTHIPSLNPLIRGDVIEVQGPPASGKTHFLYYLIINSILPLDLGGWDSIAVILDTEMTFDVLRFHQLLVARLRRLRPQVDDDTVQSLARDALNRLHIFKPDSSSQLAVTIYHLPKCMADKIPDRRIGLVAIDSISAFYWPDRYTAHQLQIASAGSEQSYNHPMSYVLKALSSLHLHYSPVIILTNWGLIPDPELTKSNPSVPMFKQHLSPFPGPFATGQSGSGPATSDDSFKITRHITLSLAPLPRFPIGTELEVARMEETNRSRQLLKGEINGVTRYPGDAGNSTFTLCVRDNDMIAL